MSPDISSFNVPDIPPFNEYPITKEHIKLMGIEIEGAWFKIKPDIRQFFRTDGSVDIDGDSGDNCACCSEDCDCDIHGCNCSNDSCDCCQQNCSCYEDHREDHHCTSGNSEFDYIGELASPTFKRYEDMMIWTDVNYPDKNNITCGIHIHLSFLRLLDYSFLMENKFRDYFEAKMITFGKTNGLKNDSQFYKRLAGQNSYCLKSFTPDLNSKGEGNKYQQLNACYFSRGTFEIRVLPCFQDKKYTLRAIKFIHDIINEYLDKCTLKKARRFRKLKIKEKIEVEI